MKRFRFDDISLNTDMKLADAMMEYIISNDPSTEVIYCISPIVFNMSKEKTLERREAIFPKILHAHSDYREFYKGDFCGMPEISPLVTTAGHGLIHVDHRLLPEAAQELSILTSCSLAKGEIFVPPFNKWNEITQDICNKHGIELVRFEDGWLSMEHNLYNKEHNLYYCHTRAFTMETWKSWFEDNILDVKSIS